MRDPLFEMAYGMLWTEFGAKGEMELRPVLAHRFSLAPRLLYEMIWVERAGEFVAVRDHTAIIAGGNAVVHLSHVLIAPAWRRKGLGGWLRALPVCAARELLAEPAAAGFRGRVTLVAEMEYAAPDEAAREWRLRAYEHAGFRKLDPSQVRYHQPDFRAAKVIDATGGARPLPFQLVVRRVGREHERAISGAEVRALVQALGEIYSAQFRPADLAHPLLALERLPADEATIALVPPTQV